MRAPVFPGLFDPPIAPAMTPIARHCSSMGALDAAERSGRQALALLALYRAQGPKTDAEAADALGIERTSVNARRAGLIRLRLVDAAPKGIRKNAATGISNSLWGVA